MMTITMCIVVALSLLRVAEFRSSVQEKRIQLLEWKYTNLLLRANDGEVFEVTEGEFQEYFVSQPRNYSGFVLFTTRDMNCWECSTVEYNFKILSHSYFQMDIQNNMKPRAFFLEILAEKESTILRMMGVDKSQLPAILFVPSKGQLQNIQELNKEMYNIENINSVVNWIEHVSGISIQNLGRRDHQQNWDTFATKLLLLVLTLFHLYLNREFIIANTTSVVGAVIVAGICYCTSGNVFNTIRPTEFLHFSPEGFALIHPSTGYQYGIESIIIFFTYCGIAAAFIKIIEAGKQIRENQAKNTNNNYSIYAVLGIFGVLFSIVYSCFEKKLSN